MKKTLVSLAAASVLASGVMAADKGVDIVTTGQAVVYYNTVGDNAKGDAGKDLFGYSNGDNTRANFGIQLNLDADLKNGFTFGSTINYLGTLGLEKNLVTGTMQNTNGGIGENNIADDIYLAQLYVAKKLGNTTLKLGRQELPKSLSPFAFSEGWNVFKNTFDAALVVNTDIPDTVVVGAYVSKSNGNGFGNDMSSFADPLANTDLGNLAVTGAAYMLTVQNKSIPMTTITATYYDLAKVAGLTSGKNGAQILWGDAQVAGKDMPLGLKVGIQGGQTSAEDSAVADTSAYGIKVGLAPIDALSICLAYTNVDGDENKANIAIRNVTGVKTPLYTQMIANQDAIALDNSTFLVKAAYNTGGWGKIIAQYGATSGDKDSLVRVNNKDTDFGEFDLIYKVKAVGINWLAAWVNQTWSEKDANNKDAQDIIRFVARYNF